MSPDHLERASIIDRANTAMEQAGLSSREFEYLLDLEAGQWSDLIARPQTNLSSDQERRVRLVIELVSILGSKKAKPEALRGWFLDRSEHLDGFSPFGWIIADTAHLQALVAAARAGQA